MFRDRRKEYEIKILDYTYTSEPSINIALPLSFSKIRTTIFVVMCLATLGFLWLLAKWSSKRKAFFMYSVCGPAEATHFLIREDEIIGGCTIIERENRLDIKRRLQTVSFCYHDRNYLYHEEKEVFLPIRYEDLGMQLDRLQKGKYEPYSNRSRKKLLQYYGPNEIQLTVQSYFEVFIEEMLTPYEVFQMYAIFLWVYEEYYIFSFMLLAYSIYTYFEYSLKVVKNQEALAKASYFNTTCKVLTKQSIRNREDEESQANDSEDYTIIEEPNGSSREEGKKEFNLSEEFPENQQETMKSSTEGNIKERLANGYNFEITSIESNKILPGDIIILKEGDIIPCDCLIISGEALIDESFINGENLLIRKIEMENYDYCKEREGTFILYLGTRIVKIKALKTDLDQRFLQNSQIHESKQSSFNWFVEEGEIACLVTQTNYNTQRGKYVRAVRYQKKPTDNFTKETIYFIYIILILTICVFVALLPITNEGQAAWDVFILFLDLLATSIPITLPTALSVGINFAEYRLSKSGIHSVLPSNILEGGRATTLVIDSNRVLGKNYNVHSIVVGIKANKTIGNTYTSLSSFLDTEKGKNTQSYFEDPDSKTEEIKKMDLTGKMLLRAFSSCHNLEKHSNRIYGSVEENHLFEFAESKFVDEDVFVCLGDSLRVKEKINFSPKEKKLGVVVEINGSSKNRNHSRVQVMEEDQVFNENVEENNIETAEKNIIFIKGPAEKIISLCKEGTYPINYHEFIVDIAEKGFKTVCFAYKIIAETNEISKKSEFLRSEFIFCGFALLEIEKNEETLDAIRELRESKMQMILISKERELETSSVAINNKMYNKNQILLCSMNNNKITCSGHLEWESNGSGDDLKEFIMDCDSFIRNCYLSLNSKLYEELFMKRDEESSERIFKRTMIFNEMEDRHSRNVYFQLERRGKVTFAVGSGASVSECANLSMELDRGECSMLSSFHTNQKSIRCITKCLIICRAALATNFHCFSMMILFSLIQFTTVVNLYFRYQNLSDSQYLYEDLFVTFPIFITINMTAPVSKLGKELPPKSFFSGRALASMVGQFLIQLIVQMVFITYLFTLNVFQADIEKAHVYYVDNAEFSSTTLTLTTFVLTNYLYLGIVMSTSVSKEFRKPFYTNPYYTITLVALWFYNTAIVFIPAIVPESIRPSNLSKEEENELIRAMVLGNIIMVIMYLYENILVWILGLFRKMKSFEERDFELELN